MNMEYTSDSDLSKDTRDLVSRGLASVKRKRRMTTMQSDGVHERFSDSNMDTSKFPMSDIFRGVESRSVTPRSMA